MKTIRQPSSNFWSTVVKVVIFCLALYLAFLILRPVLSFLLGIGFWVLKVLVFVTVALLVVHLFLRLIFNIDLLGIILKK